jgi:multidrug transporter EmrE-like cation transporter
MIITTVKTDKVGIIASALCMIHCIATPFLFLAKSSSVSCCEDSPNWWSSLDFLFLLISFFAIYQVSKNSTKNLVKYAMWTSWAFLLTILLNEKIHLFSLYEYTIYFPALTLVILHFYNLKYCQCKTDTCCTNLNNYEKRNN